MSTKVTLTELGFIIAFCLVSGAVYKGCYAGTTEDITITVNRRDSRFVSNGDGGTARVYQVFTDGEVFDNEDDWFFGKFNSSDVQNQLREGRTCDVQVAGWRLPFLSTYRNITHVYRCHD